MALPITWFRLLLQMLEDHPCQLPQIPDLVLNPTNNESGSANLGRMTHLYSSQGISSQATDLQLSSWRSKTNSSYNSSFAKWASWCEQRGRNPTAGPIEDIVNFLADLFKQGFKYNSLNSYHSAISSTHERV